MAINIKECVEADYKYRTREEIMSMDRLMMLMLRGKGEEGEEAGRAANLIWRCQARSTPAQHASLSLEKGVFPLKQSITNYHNRDFNFPRNCGGGSPRASKPSHLPGYPISCKIPGYDRDFRLTSDTLFILPS